MSAETQGASIRNGVLSPCASRSHRSTRPSVTSTATSAGSSRRSPRPQQQGAGFTLLPELAITGYPPEDLLHKEHFVEDNLDALEMVSAACGHMALVGFVDRDGDDLYNAVALCGNDRVLQIYHKRRLPNYGVFDEAALLRAGRGAGSDRTRRRHVRRDHLRGHLGARARRGGRRAGRQGALQHLGVAVPRGQGRRARGDAAGASARQQRCGSRTATSSAGRTSWSSTAAASSSRPSGDVVARGASFAEDLVIADFTPGAKLGASARSRADARPATRRSTRRSSSALRDYVRKNGFTDVVVGLSGGIDSALVAAIAADALGPGARARRAHAEPLLLARAASTTRSSSPRALGIETLRAADRRAVPGVPRHARSPRSRAANPTSTEENLQARVRGTLLMALSNKFGWLPLATGNKSELSVGYSTLYGDMVGGFAPIKDVFKTRVYELARWRNAHGRGPVIPQAIIDKAPSAELRAGPDRPGLAAAVRRARRDPRRTTSSRTTAETTSSRWASPREIVDRVIRMTDAAEYKRRQGPDRRQDHPEGVRQGSPDADHEPVSAADVVGSARIEIVDPRLGRASTRCSTLYYRRALRPVRRRARRRVVPPGARQHVRGRACRATASFSAARGFCRRRGMPSARCARSSSRRTRRARRRARAHDARSSAKPRAQGARELWLNARHSAYGFYESARLDVSSARSS